MNQMENVQNFDDLLKENKPKAVEEKKPGRKKKSKVDKPKEKMSEYDLKTSGNFIGSVAKTKLEKYLSKSPQFKVISEQIKILMDEFKTYKSIGDEDNMVKTQELIKNLQQTKSKFTKQFKQKNYQADKEKYNKAVKESETVDALKTKLNQLDARYKSLNPNSLVSKLSNYRKDLSFLSNEDDFDFEDTIQDFDDLITDEKTNELNQTEYLYKELCAHISDLIGVTPKEVSEMSNNTVLKHLKEFAPDISDLVNEIDETKFEISAEINKLKGNEDITNIIFDTFDFESSEEELPKEMLAAANVDLVKAIAFNLCSKLNMLHNINDAEAYGFMGLSIAINKWYSIQKMKDSAVSFTGFGNLYISNYIRRGLHELTSGGMLNPSSIATLHHKRKKQIESFVSNNPELKDMPTEMLETIIESTEITKTPDSVVTEGEYSATVGGEDGGEADVWSNALFDADNGEKLITAKFEYENLLKSIKTLFGLFETKTDKETGLSVKGKKMFDKFDYKLFKLMFGLEYKKDETGKNSDYSQAEIAQVMTEYAHSLGYASKSFSQSAISTRTQVLIDKIRSVMELYPDIKIGFEYLWNYHQSNFTKPDQFPDELQEINTSISDDLISQLSSGQSIQNMVEEESELY